MNWIRALLLAVSLTSLTACATGVPRGYVDVSTEGVNYTEDQIAFFSVRTTSDEKTGAFGSALQKFSDGATGGTVCCAPIPGVGQFVKVVWEVTDPNQRNGQAKAFSRDVRLIGTTPANTAKHSLLIVRFFDGHEVEAEIIPGDGDLGPSNPRMDRLFFAGPKLMRKKGE